MRRATGRAYVLPFYNKFQSTLSMRRATITIVGNLTADPISIHALHEESDRAATA